MDESKAKQKIVYLEEANPAEASKIGGTDVDLVDYFYYVLHRIKFVILAVILGAGITFAYTFFLATPLYEATAQLYVVNSKDSVINLSDMQIGSYLANDYQLVFKTWEVNDQVIRNLNLPYSIEEMGDMMNITNPTSTRVLFITITSPDPQLAASIANEYASVASEYISQTMDTDAPRLLSTAVAPSVPVSPHRVVNMLVGSLGSLFLSLIVLLLSYLRNDKVVTEEDILKYTGVSTLVVVPAFNTQTAKRKSILPILRIHKPRRKRA